MPLSNVREAYNAKGRQSTAGKRKKGKPKRVHDEPLLKQSVQDNANAPILVPKTKGEKETDKRDRLVRELAAESESKWTSKKKKRLEKYIDKKLKREERVLIFEKLSRSQASMSSEMLHSSAMLGTGKTQTYFERLEKREDKAVRHALDGTLGKRKRHMDTFAVDNNDSSDEDLDNTVSMIAEDADPTLLDGEPGDSKSSPVPVVPFSQPQPISKPSTVGSALQKNPDGTIVLPKMRPKKNKQVSQKAWIRNPVQPVAEDSDTSFDSSDSAYGSADSEVDEDGDEDRGSESSDSADEHMLVEKLEPLSRTKRKSLGFKDWAMKQLNTARGYTPPVSDQNAAQTQPLPSEPLKKKRKIDSSQPQEMRGPLGEDLVLPSTSFATKVLGITSQATPSSSSIKVVEVKRPPEVEEARILLPIVTEEQPIMEAIMLHPVVIICGETGSGKTTQVPQFLYEAGFGTLGSDNPGMIGITQPRRVAAMSMASRVAHELSLTSSEVSYQIRYDATVSPTTSIKFMTDGVLLRELATDFLLTKYSVIIIDEAHERSMNTDILIGVLSRIIKLRAKIWKEGKGGAKPLRLIIMSATLRVTDFSENETLFSIPPPVINVAARQHPVTVHFSRRTFPDYVTEAVKKAIKIHTRLPPGGILIFLTGQNEITAVCRKLDSRFGQKSLETKRNRRSSLANRPNGDKYQAETRTIGATQADIEPEEIDLSISDGDDFASDVDNSGDVEEDLDALDSDDETKVEDGLGLDNEAQIPMHVVPLYSLLSSEEQMKVFVPPPPGCRLVTVSTNVAETSLTIPGIRYVIDCGRVKERRHDIASGIQAFQVTWISKASAQQRAGRAGRTGSGHCYRLYSSALYEHHFEQFTQPEISRMPIDGVVLQMKSMHIDAVINFPFPTAPDRSALKKSESTLMHLGALSQEIIANGIVAPEGKITDLGRTMALFPLTPRFSRMLVSGQQHGCLPYVISIVSALSVGDPFLYEELINHDQELGDSDSEAISDSGTRSTTEAKELHRRRRKAFFESQHTHASLGKYTSDIFKILSVVGAYEFAGGGIQFCAQQFVRPKAMEEIHKLRAQICNIVRMNFPNTDAKFFAKIQPPTDFQVKVLRQLMAAAFIDQVAVRKDRVETTSSTGLQYANSKGVPYKALGISEDVFIHPSSILANAPPPEFVTYCEVVRTTHVYMKGLTVVSPSWLGKLGKPLLCSFSKPIQNNAGQFMVIPRFGANGWELPAMRADEIS